jgi:hypothetical protein
MGLGALSTFCGTSNSYCDGHPRSVESHLIGVPGNAMCIVNLSRSQNHHTTVDWRHLGERHGLSNKSSTARFFCHTPGGCFLKQAIDEVAALRFGWSKCYVKSEPYIDL